MTDARGRRPSARYGALVLLTLTLADCARTPPPSPPAQARNLLLVTVDTLRADRVGAYGYRAARTPNMDGVAARGVRFDHAFATAPITLTSHASMMTGLYPPGHHARHNGLRVDDKVPTLAASLASAGLATAAFVGAFPLDRRFGLNRGFTVYDDVMPRDDRGRVANERPGRLVVDAAIAWLNAHRSARFFLWVHLFEPHAPYGDPRSARSTADRYDDDVAEADAQIGRLVSALGIDASQAVVAIAGDHGEAFGEHGEVSHSLFVYDTTLRVPLIIAAPGLQARVAGAPISVVDLAPTLLTLLGLKPFDTDGIDVLNASDASLAARELYAESYAPLLDFGWSPLRSVRAGHWKYIAAPNEELYDIARDPGEANNLALSEQQTAAGIRGHVNRYGTEAISAGALDPDARSRLQSLGYLSGTRGANSKALADPKDRRALARSLAEVLSGEIQGPALENALRAILKEDPRNVQAHMRMGHYLVESNRCGEAVPHLKTAIASHLPGADAHLELALCQVQASQLAQAEATLRAAAGVEPGNPVVLANLGMVLSDEGKHAEGVAPLRKAVEIDRDFHEARFNLARVLARGGRRDEARREAAELLKRLPVTAPQRPEVLRLLEAIQN